MAAKIIIACMAIVTIITGCDDVENMLKFKVTDQTTLRIQSTSPLNLPLEVPTPDVTSNSQQQYENNNTHVNLVKDVRLEELKLSISKPDAKTFSFLKSITIFISTDQHTEIELAKVENITTGANTINLIPSKEKLDAYIKAASYNLRTEVITRETLTENVDIVVDIRFLVTADTF